MSDKTFKIIITAVMVMGVISVIAITLYTIYLYTNCSIISYIANRG